MASEGIKGVTEDVKAAIALAVTAHDALRPVYDTVSKYNSVEKPRLTSSIVRFNNLHDRLQLINGAYLTRVGMCDPPAQLFLKPQSKSTWAFRPGFIHWSTKGCVIYELRDLRNTLGDPVELLPDTEPEQPAQSQTSTSSSKASGPERVFIVAGVWSGMWRTSRMMLSVVRTRDNIDLTGPVGLAKLYKSALRKKFSRPGARLRKGGRLGKDGFSVTAQMNESNPAQLVVELEHWDCCDTEYGAYLLSLDSIRPQSDTGENDIIETDIEDESLVQIEKYRPRTDTVSPDIQPRHYPDAAVLATADPAEDGGEGEAEAGEQATEAVDPEEPPAAEQSQGEEAAAGSQPISPIGILHDGLAVATAVVNFANDMQGNAAGKPEEEPPAPPAPPADVNNPPTVSAVVPSNEAPPTAEQPVDLLAAAGAVGSALQQANCLPANIASGSAQITAAINTPSIQMSTAINASS